ncbi:MAG: hypothetical protein JO249_21075 [Acidobacteria bacterium]|nr:hypothetical protein [Acidobacteriota bacterium]
MSIQVECYSGWKSEERPVRFRVDLHEYIIHSILDQWDGSNHVFFKVRAHNRNV